VEQQPIETNDQRRPFMPKIAAKASQVQQSVQNYVQRYEYALKEEHVSLGRWPVAWRMRFRRGWGWRDRSGRWMEEDGMGKWLISAPLLGLLVMALWGSYGLWITVVASVPAWVWLLLAIGGGLYIVLGAGLMMLVFYSNRMGFDEPPGVVEPSNESRH
jgi:hypothetical protein